MTRGTAFTACSIVAVEIATMGCGTEDAKQATTQIVDSPLFSSDAAFYDPPTIGGPPTTCRAPGTTLLMHCCPQGTAMIGANIGGNQFKCRMLSPTPDSAEVYLSSETVIAGGLAMRGCTQQAVMMGFHAVQNKAICQKLRFAFTNDYLDNGNSDGVMHVCAVPYAIRGIHVVQNKFACLTDTNH